MKTINTLVSDIYEQVKGNGGWDATITKFLSDQISTIAEQKFEQQQTPRDYLSLSSLGMPVCKLWYKVNQPELAEELSAEALGTFFYGDILEAVVISLAMASGHRVEGLQEPLQVFGVPGSSDCIIDGVVVDVKSASSFGFQKFKKNALKEDDPFGYISQLSSYLYGYGGDKRVTNKNIGAFLVVEKQRFKLCLDIYDLSEELANKKEEVAKVKAVVNNPEKPPRCFSEIPDGKSGNMKLPTPCSYCEFRKACWGNYRTFLYSDGPRYLTKVVNEPKVYEDKE